jgi:hypothetical protein
MNGLCYSFTWEVLTNIFLQIVILSCSCQGREFTWKPVNICEKHFFDLMSWFSWLRYTEKSDTFSLVFLCISMELFHVISWLWIALEQIWHSFLTIFPFIRGEQLWDHHTVCVPPLHFLTSWLIFMKFCMNVMPLKTTPTSYNMAGTQTYEVGMIVAPLETGFWYWYMVINLKKNLLLR